MIATGDWTFQRLRSAMNDILLFFDLSCLHVNFVGCSAASRGCYKATWLPSRRIAYSGSAASLHLVSRFAIANDDQIILEELELVHA